MTAKRFIFEQDGNFHTVIDTVENKPMGVFEFKENEFSAYACFHMIIDKMNELHEENAQFKNKLKFYNELNKPYDAIIEENTRLKAFIKRLTNNCGKIILMNGMGYNVNKILGDLE